MISERSKRRFLSLVFILKRNNYRNKYFPSKNGVTELVFELLTVKAKIKGVFRRSYCCYSNLKIPKCSAMSWQFFVTIIVSASTDKKRVIMTHQNLILEECLKRLQGRLGRLP